MRTVVGLVVLIALGWPAQGLAQRGGFGGGRGGFGGLGGGGFGQNQPSAPDLPGPELEGPPDSATVRSLFNFTADQVRRYAQAYDSFMVATKPERDSAQTAQEIMYEKLDAGDRPAAMFYVSRLRRLGKYLKERQAKFEDTLPTFLSSDEIKAYKKWRKDEDVAAEDRRKEEALRWRDRGDRGGGRMFGGGEGFNPGADRPVDQKMVVDAGVAPDIGSQAVRVGRTLYVAGQVALDATGSIVGDGDLAVQSRQAFANLTAVLGAAHSSPGDVVELTVDVVDYRPKDLDVVRQAAALYLSGRNPPVVTVLGVQSLSRPGFLISVRATALTNVIR